MDKTAANISGLYWVSEEEVKGQNSVPLLDDRANLVQCSGTAPCTRCANGGWKCLYNLAGDRRRKAHTAELLNFRDALRRIAAKLRSGTPEEISQLIWEIQNLPTDQDAVSILLTDAYQMEVRMFNLNTDWLPIKPSLRERTYCNSKFGQCYLIVNVLGMNVIHF